MDNETLVKDVILFDVNKHIVEDSYDPGDPNPRKKQNNSNIVFNYKIKTVSPEKFEEMKSVYDTVCVNDYGDDYHLSEEEKEKRSKYYEVFMRLKRCKKKFRKLDEFGKVFRIALDCLDLVAKYNGVYQPDKFKKLVLRGEIEVYALTFPKYIGRDKNNINWKYVSEFILDKDKDPSELSADKETPLEDLSIEELKERLFTKEELDYIEELVNRPEDDVIRSFDENDEETVLIGTKKDLQKMVKQSPDLVRTAKDIVKAERRRANMRNQLNSFAFNLSHDDFQEIAEMDRKRGYRSDSDIPEFKGDIMNRNDYKKYLYQLQMYEENEIKENYQGHMRTQAEINEIKVKDMLEKAGWNLRKMYRNKEMEELKKAYKRDKKREERLKNQILKIQKRQKARKKTGEIEFDVNKKKKKKKNKDKEDD